MTSSDCVLTCGGTSFSAFSSSVEEATLLRPFSLGEDITSVVKEFIIGTNYLLSFLFWFDLKSRKSIYKINRLYQSKHLVLNIFLWKKKAKKPAPKVTKNLRG